MFQRQKLDYEGIKVTGREGRDPVTASCVLQTMVSPRRMKRWSNCAVSVLDFAGLPPLLSSSEERASEGFRGKTRFTKLEQSDASQCLKSPRAHSKVPSRRQGLLKTL